MVTITFAVKPYLAKYMYVRYGQCLESFQSGSSPQSSVPIHLSHISPVYHLLYQSTVPHPKGAPWKETGNICFVLPSPRYGKSPETYNYIGQENLLVIEKEIEAEMKAELYSYLLDNRFNKGMMYKKSMHHFVEYYKMEELVQEESLMRAFQRWRKLVKEENNNRY